MAGWHHQCNEYELGQTRGGERHRGLACCSPWGHKELDMTGRLNKTTNFDLLFCFCYFPLSLLFPGNIIL